MAGKREITLRRESVLKKLRNLDQKYKFAHAWDGEVARAFKENETFCFDELVRKGLDDAEALIARWEK